MAEKQAMALGVLNQKHGPVRRPVGYLSKRLDLVTTGWHSCIVVAAALALLVEEASKLMLGQPLTVYTSHQVTSLLEGKGNFRLTDSRILKYQTLLLVNPDLHVMICSSLNPATLLPFPEEGLPAHPCEDIISHSLLP